MAASTWASGCLCGGFKSGLQYVRVGDLKSGLRGVRVEELKSGLHDDSI